MNKNVTGTTSLRPQCHTTGFRGVAQHAFSFLFVFKTSDCCVNMRDKEKINKSKKKLSRFIQRGGYMLLFIKLNILKRRTLSNSRLEFQPHSTT